MQVLKAVNCLRASLPRLAEVVEPLRVVLEEHMGGINRRASRIESGDRGDSMEAGAGGCVKQC